MENGKLYICKDGEFEELAGIASLDDISIEEKEEDKMAVGIDLASSYDFTGVCHINPQVSLSFFLGKPVSNNWLAENAWRHYEKEKKK